MALAASDDVARDDCQRQLLEAYERLRQRASKVLFDRSLVDDCVQETALRVFRDCIAGKIQGEFLHYASGVLSNVVLEMLRKQNRREVPLEDEVAAVSDDDNAESPAPAGLAALFARDRAWSIFSDAFQERYATAFDHCWQTAVIEKERALLIQYHSQYGSGVEMARALGITANALTLRIRKLQARLRTCAEAGTERS